MKHITIGPLCIAALFLLFGTAAWADETAPPACAKDVAPQSRAAPKWPRLDAQRSREGQATYQFLISENGRLSDFVLVDAKSTSERDSFAQAFAREALRALKKWRYQPLAQACVHTQTIEFRLN